MILELSTSRICLRLFGRLVGFEALGNKDEFQTAALDLWLQQTGSLHKC